MASNKHYIHRILTTASSLMGILTLSSGIYGLLNPQAFSTTLGIPIPNPPPPSLALPFVSFAAARNIGSGISTLVLLATGQTKAVGTVMMCGVVVCLTDAWVCVQFGESAVEGKAVGHAFMGGVAGVVGGGLYWVSSI
ncbi:hypothetical protein DL98DRAFT_579402 [Cadophora sp. DSE1049]|nr:hypothetical protein DL98DRAFT_579402 [Cadophora sp. DSE1049]